MMRVETSTVTDLTDMTDAQLEREFQSQIPQPPKIDFEDNGQGSDNTQSTDRPGSSDSARTSSGQSDQSTEDDCGTGGYPNSRSKCNKKSHQPSVLKSLRKIGSELNDDTRRMFSALRGRLQRGHGPRQTKVKAVHILPGDDDTRWARRLASGSATSHSSSGSDPLSSENS